MPLFDTSPQANGGVAPHMWDVGALLRLAHQIKNKASAGMHTLSGAYNKQAENDALAEQNVGVSKLLQNLAAPTMFTQGVEQTKIPTLPPAQRPTPVYTKGAGVNAVVKSTPVKPTGNFAGNAQGSVIDPLTLTNGIGMGDLGGNELPQELEPLAGGSALRAVPLVQTAKFPKDQNLLKALLSRVF